MGRDTRAYVKKWRDTTKDRMVLAMGGECVICGYKKCTSALALHHLDPKEKELSFAKIRANPKSWDKIVVELRKCILVCTNCHNEIHEGIIEIPKDVKRFNEEFSDFYVKKAEQFFDICPICGGKKRKNLITCSHNCAAKMSRKVDWDNIDLTNLIKTKSNTEIGFDLGITEASVRKRMKVLNIKR
jgi:hypothetical protein